MATDTKLLTVPETARLLEVDKGTIRRWIKAGMLRTIVLPHKGNYLVHRVDASLVQRILAKRGNGRA